MKPNFRIVLAAAVALALGAAASAPAQFMYVHTFNGGVDGRVTRYNDATGAAVPFTNPILLANNAGAGTCFAPGMFPDLFVAYGNIVTGAGTHAIRRYDRNTGALIGNFVSGPASTITNPIMPTIGPDGHLYVSQGFESTNGQRTKKYDGTTGAGLASGPGLGGFIIPYGIAFHPTTGDVLVAEWPLIGMTNHRIRRYTSGLAFVSDFVAAGGPEVLRQPLGLSYGPDGNLYVASVSGNRILRYNGTTGAFIDIFVAAGSGGLNAPYGMAWGPDGNLYVASSGAAVMNAGAIRRYNGTTGAFIDNFVTGLTDPVAVQFDFPVVPVELSAFGLE